MQMRMHRACLWMKLLYKRFFSSRIYLFLLLFVPVLVFGMRLAAADSDGMYQVLLLVDGDADETCQAVVSGLTGKMGLVTYSVTEDEESAREAVLKGSVKNLWIIPGALEEELTRFVIGEQESLVTIVEKSETISSKLVREQLSGVLAPYMSFATVTRFIRNDAAESGIGLSVSDEKLKEMYQQNRVEGSLFAVTYTDGTSAAEDLQVGTYLIAPMRGILAAFVFLSGMALTLFYMADRETGVFLRVGIRHRKCFAWCYLMTGLIPAGLAALFALFLSGLAEDPLWELLLMALYLAACAGADLCLMRILGSVRTFGAAIPAVILISLLLCPVFIDLKIPFIRNVLAPYYYLNALHSGRMALLLAGYAAVTGVIGVSACKNGR